MDFNVNSKIGTLHLIGCDQVGVQWAEGKTKIKNRKTIKKRKWCDGSVCRR